MLYVVVFLLKSDMKCKFALFTKPGELLIIDLLPGYFYINIDRKSFSDANERMLDNYG